MKNVDQTKPRLQIIIIIALCFGVIGCTQSSINDSKPKDSALLAAAHKLDPVELVWYYPQYKANADLQLVNEEVNKIVREKLNATVKLQPVNFSSYEQKLNTIVAANESVDLIWTSNWLFPWVLNANKGAFLPLDDLLSSYGQKLYESIPEKFWGDGKLEGNLYGIPNYQIAAMRPSLVIAKRFLDKYNLDVNTIRRIDDIEPFLKQIKEGEPGIVPFGTTRGFYSNVLYGIDWKVPIYHNDPNHKVLPDVTPEMRENFALAHSWYVKGYINQDAAILKTAAEAYNKGTTAVWFDLTGKPGSEVEYKAGNGGYDVVLVPLVNSVLTGMASSMIAISNRSKNPERAIMFLELVNTDKQLYNLLVYGIEGKHYTKTTGNYIKLNQDSGYFTNTDWVFGNINNEYLPEGAPADKLARTIKANNEATVSPYASFIFNTEPVKAELANLKAVNDEYYAVLATGTVDPDEYLPIYEKKLKQAGSDAVVAEKQKQIDEWLKTNGKN